MTPPRHTAQRDHRFGHLGPTRAAQDVAVVVLLVGLALVTYRPQVFGSALFPWDWLGRMSTGPSFVSAVISTGEWPTWVPFQGSGAPMAPDIGSGLYYPVHWLTGILGVPLTADLQATLQVLHVAAGAIGLHALARARGVDRVWAAVAAVAFLYFGGFSGQATHMHHVRGFALFPWLLWSVTDPIGSRKRVLLLPVLAWLLAAGAYPGQLPVFATAAAAYGAVELWQARERIAPRDVGLLAMAGASAALAVAAVVWPFLAAGAAGLLHRPVEPTTAVRAQQAMGLTDVLGLHLDRWTSHGLGAELRAWSVGVPTLVGVAAVRRADVRAHLPVITAAGVGFAWMLLPRVPGLQEPLMAIHPSRFPFADAKVTVAVALVLGGAIGWSNLVGSPRTTRRRALAAVALLAAAAWVVMLAAPTGRITDAPWLLAGVLVASAALAWWAPRRHLLVVLVGLLVVVDGLRIMHDQDFEDRPSPESPWEVQLADDELDRRETAVQQLPELLERPPTTRPSRTPPFVSPDERASGHPRDALGFLGLGHNMTAYGGFVTEARWEAVTDPELAERIARAWTAWVVPCDQQCRRAGTLPPPSTWQQTPQLTTTRYGTDRIDYAATFEQEAVVVENEIQYPGWTSSSPAVTSLQHDGPLRAWVIGPGDHRWSATYTPPEARLQVLLAVAAVLGSVTTAMYARRRRSTGSGRSTS